jgi:ATP-dependent Clp protease adaptor protein ClpS
MSNVNEELAIDEKVKIDVQPPKMWKVILLNDDVTPMDLVIEILISYFKHDQDSAQKITMEIHNTGSGIAGVYPHELAEHLALESTNFARLNGSPLKIKIEQE